MQLRKVCNHPYLLEKSQDSDGSQFIESGKMILLDKLLQKLAKEQHRVVISSQMTKMLDILEDYCCFKQYKVKIS